MQSNFPIDKERPIISIMDKIKAYFALTKPRVMMLVLFTGITYASCAAHAFDSSIDAFGTAVQNENEHIQYNWKKYYYVLLALTLASGSCGAINMAMEHRTDLTMRRTKNRPIPSGRVSVLGAYVFGFTLLACAIYTAYVYLNTLTAILLGASIFLYVPVYTRLKQYTPHAIFIGDVPGAMPPIIVSSAVNKSITLMALELFLFIFIWTIPHSYALAMHYKQDYIDSNVPHINHNIPEVQILTIITIATWFTCLLGVIMYSDYYIYTRYAVYAYIWSGYWSISFISMAYKLNTKSIGYFQYFKSSVKYMFAMCFGFCILNLLPI